MKHKLRLFNLVLIVVFIFSLTACTTPKTTTVETTTQIEKIETTTTTIENSGLTETQRKKAYYELAVLQDSIALEDPPDRDEQMAKAYSIIAEKYGITKDEMMQITAEDEARGYSESIIDTIREPLIALDQDLRVVEPKDFWSSSLAGAMPIHCNISREGVLL